MNKQLIEFLLNLIPLTYGSFLLIKVFRITKKSTEQQLVEIDAKLIRMKRSASIFFIVGAYFMYQFYHRYYS